MAGLWLPDPRIEMPELFELGRKPVGNVKIDWSHRLASDLVACFIPSTENMELVSGHICNSNSGTHMLNPKITSICSEASYISGEFLSTGMAVDEFTDQITMVSGYYWDGVTQSEEASFIRQALSSGYYALELFHTTVGSVRALLKTDGASGWTTSNDVNLPNQQSNTYQSCGAVYKNGENLKVFINGKLEATKTVSGTFNPGSSDRAESLKFNGGEHLGNRPISGGVFYAYVYKTAKTDLDIASLHANPYQFLIPA